MDEKSIDLYNQCRNHSALLPDLGLRLIELTGEDRLEWLQGQATNDLRSIVPASEPISFCLCQATGQIEAVCDVWAEISRLLVVTDAPGATVLLDRAEKMVILEDVQARDLSDQFHLRSDQGPASANSGSVMVDFFWEDNTWQNFKSDEETKHAIIGLRSHRLGMEGFDFWIRNGFRDPYGPMAWELGGDDRSGGEEPLSRKVYEILRIEAGVPLRGVDYNEKTLPPELGPAFEAQHVSYNKGCYTGQEVLMRIHSRGHTNRTWVGLTLDSPVSPGDKVSHSSRDDAGVVTSAVISPTFGPIAAAVLRNEASAEGEEVKVGAATGRVKTLPFFP